jgi:hypothetical protein
MVGLKSKSYDWLVLNSKQEGLRLVGFKYQKADDWLDLKFDCSYLESREAPEAYDDVLISAYYADYHIKENAAAWSVDLLMIVLYFLWMNQLITTIITVDIRYGFLPIKIHLNRIFSNQKYI